jgi:ABC-type bacteriocin/lantibiotic exporter with double-glycine peptidase domain
MKNLKRFLFKRQIFFVLFFLFASVAVCNSASLQSIVTGIASGKASKGHYLKDVPVFAQGDKLCGPAALATVMNFHGVEQTQQQIADKVFTEKAQGTFTLDMLLYAKDAEGLIATHYSGDLNDIRRRIRDGNPLVLFIKSGYRRFPKGHYVVVTGFSDTYKVVILHNGGDKPIVMRYRKLLAAWRKTAYSTLLVVKEQ